MSPTGKVYSGKCICDDTDDITLDKDTPSLLAFKGPDGRITVYGGENHVKWEFAQPLGEARRFCGSGDIRYNPLIHSVISADADNAVRIWKL